MSTIGKQRAIVVAGGLFMLALGGGLLAGGISDLTTLVRGFQENRGVIVSDRLAGSGIFGGIFSLSLAAVCFLSPPAQQEPSSRRRRRKGQTRAERLAAPYMLFVLVCILAALFAPIVQQVAVTWAATTRGYVHCPEITWPRHQPDRWARPGSAEACPHEGASPNS